MSTTYISVIVMVLAQLLPKFGVLVESDALTTTVTTLATLFAGLWILIKRYRQGGVNFAGVRN